MPLYDPPHPGEMVREECLAPLGLSVTEAARVLGVTRQALNNVVNEKAGISPEMAIRLEKAFGGEADFWLRLQTAFDLAQARRREGSIAVDRYVPESA
ncbi:MAG TPA: addiction module antidote protein, HigA family [Aurantimonas coralicida]|uniref:Addiction module antidote protein, HigA family n=2 Tax=root TaxID=1 RepID=A0A9C9NF58_9HYPH|nr:HigA family addiction module antitoxin [Aurantimonas sp. A3-2-R12]MEC5322084.1 HigA family addiction module antitoxin [Aurantimonas sp. A3-2-R12]HDZ71934.1 addiction module antidote protein, HigA family [Aurantimonas coralicida]HEU00085.1 addiction module antidote protein, HigA family [Aurantimonas coralicida]